MWKWQLLSLVLSIALATSVGLGIYQSHNASNDLAGTVLPDGSMSFTFLWGPEAQHYVNGTFRIDVIVSFETLTWDNASAETVNIVVKVHDDDYSSDAYLGLTLDMNHNGKIDFGPTDDPALLFADNTTVRSPFLEEEGFLTWPEMPIEGLNACTYYLDEGYTFGPYRFALGEVMSKFGSFPAYIPVHICFGREVSFQFCAYPDKEAIPEIPAYMIQITAVNATIASQLVAVEGKINPPISFKLVQLLFWKDGWPCTSGPTMTDRDGNFKRVFSENWFESGTYSVSAKLNNSTSNAVEFMLG